MSESELELRKIRIALSWLLVFVIFTSIYFARDLLLPIFLGIMLTLTFSPVVRWLRRWGVAPPVTAMLVMAILGTSGVVSAYLASGPVSTWIEDLPALGRQIEYKMAGLTDSVEKIRDVSKDVGDMTKQKGPGAPQEVQVERPSILSSAASGVMTVATTLIVALVLATFLLASGTLFHEKLVESFDRFEDKKRALSVVKAVEKRISRYLLSITAINAGLGVSIAAAMWAIGLPNYLVWGLVAFLLNYLPFIGAVVGAALVAGVSILTFDSVPYALLAPLAYYVLTAIEGNFVTPALLGRNLELNTASVFLALVLWAWLWGIAGALMAVPFLVTFKLICDNVPGLAIVGNFLGTQRNRELARNERRPAE